MNTRAGKGAYILQTHSTKFLRRFNGGFEPPSLTHPLGKPLKIHNTNNDTSISLHRTPVSSLLFDRHWLLTILSFLVLNFLEICHMTHDHTDRRKYFAELTANQEN